MSGFDSKREAAQDKQEVYDGDYGCIDEMMHWVTIGILFLMTIVFLGGLAGVIWAMI
jgi:hypothetical protein